MQNEQCKMLISEKGEKRGQATFLKLHFEIKFVSRRSSKK
jgi:hypothetical protein